MAFLRADFRKFCSFIENDSSKDSLKENFHLHIFLENSLEKVWAFNPNSQLRIINEIHKEFFTSMGPKGMRLKK